MRQIKQTKYGRILHADSLDLVRTIETESVDLIFTSPPYDLNRKKEYGNETGAAYQTWILDFGKEFHRILKGTGSLVMDLGGGWTSGLPTKNLFEYRLLLNFVDDLNFHLAQDFFWWDPTRLPTPAQWVNVERTRVKDAVNKIWWLSKSANPKSDNRQVLQQYSKAMRLTLLQGTNTGKRASGHQVSDKFTYDNGGSIPPNLIAVSNSISSDTYSRFCEDNEISVHPARIHPLIPEFFIRMLTEPGDQIVDPFAGSCVTGAVAEYLERNWLCCDKDENYLLGAIGRFQSVDEDMKKFNKPREYRISAPNFSSNTSPADEPLALQTQFSLFPGDLDQFGSPKSDGKNN